MQGQHLGHERAVEDAAEQRVREYPGVGALEAQRPQAVEGHREGDQEGEGTGRLVQPAGPARSPYPELAVHPQRGDQLDQRQ